MSDFKVFEGKSLSDVFKDIYDNSATNKKLSQRVPRLHRRTEKPWKFIKKSNIQSQHKRNRKIKVSKSLQRPFCRKK